MWLSLSIHLSLVIGSLVTLALIGSANLDFRGLVPNFEAMSLFQDGRDPGPDACGTTATVSDV
jgi:hypothetical protein